MRASIRRLCDLRFPSSGTAPYMKVLKGELPIQQWGWAKAYKENFDKGTIRPVFHVCLFIGVLGYTLDYARHLRRAFRPPPSHPPPLPPTFAAGCSPLPSPAPADERHSVKEKHLKEHH